MKNVALIIFFLTTIIPITTGFSKSDAPVISGLEVDPISGPVGSKFMLSLHIIDPQGLGDIIQILYQLREGVEAIEVPLNDKGVDGDRKAGDGIYSGQSIVPKTASKQMHRFQVFVRDKGGHKSNILEYQFTVVEGITI